MSSRSVLVGLGVAVVTFGLLAVAVIELVVTDPGAGILGVGAGLFGGIVAGVAVGVGYDRVGPTARVGLETVAVFGYALVAVGAVVYTGVGVGTWAAVAASGAVAVVYLFVALVGRTSA